MVVLDETSKNRSAGMDINRALSVAVRATERAFEGAPGRERIPEPQSVDHFIDLLRPGSLHALIGPAKPTGPLLVHIAAKLAVARCVNTLFASPHGSEAVLAQRFLADVARVHPVALRNGDLDVEDWVKITRAVPRLEAAPLRLVGRGSIGELLAALTHDVQAVVIDDLPAIPTRAPERLIDDLAAAASVLNVPVLVMAPAPEGATLADICLPDDAFDVIGAVSYGEEELRITAWRSRQKLGRRSMPARFGSIKMPR